MQGPPSGSLRFLRRQPHAKIPAPKQLSMASASRRRGSLGDRRGFFRLCGSPIRTHKMELDYVHGKAHSPTQLRPAEPADVDTPLMQRRPGKKVLKQKQRHAEADAAMAALARQLGQEGGGYYDSPRAGLYGLGRSPVGVDSDAPMSCMADEGSNNSMRLEGARQAGIPLYLSDWFDPNKASTQRRRQTNVVMTREEPESESSALSNCSDAKDNSQFLKPHQNVDMADVVIGRVIGEGAFGKVFKASWKGRDVAVKVLIRQNLSADVVREFETEVKIMSFLHHPNICMLLGACLAPENRALVIELVEQGSLGGVADKTAAAHGRDARSLRARYGAWHELPASLRASDPASRHEEPQPARGARLLHQDLGLWSLARQGADPDHDRQLRHCAVDGVRD